MGSGFESQGVHHRESPGRTRKTRHLPGRLRCTTFAVVLKLTGAGEEHTSEDAWTPVTGNPLDAEDLTLDVPTQTILWADARIRELEEKLALMTEKFEDAKMGVY